MRNFAGLPFDGVEFRKVWDANKILSFLKFKLAGKVDYQLLNRFHDYGLGKVDLFHFFNTLTPSKRPWIVTFETTLPRLEPAFEKGYEWMAASSCKRLIAITRRSYDAQLHLLRGRVDYEEVIRDKMMILPPSQPLLLDDLGSKDFDGELRMVFVGRDFYRKGGWELLRAFELLKAEGLPVRLTIVSDLNRTGFKDGYITPEIESKVVELLSSNPMIEYHRSLPNEEVLALLKKAHIGILPSWHETYGYFLLEAMACGCAVVAPNVSPFPEFLSEKCGWLLDVDTYSVDGAEGSDPTEENQIRMIGAIKDTVVSAFSDRAGLYAKCQYSLDMIRMNHDPLVAAGALTKVYQEVL